MPVTAKLSKAFYDKMGDQVATEPVEWFNNVDATYRGNLREINELNFARFDAKVEQRFAQSDAKWEQRFAQFETRIERRFGEQTRWPLAMWATVIIALVGLYLRHRARRSLTAGERIPSLR